MKDLPPGQQLAAPGKWPMVGERMPAAPTGRWIVEISGLVESPRTLDLDDLRAMPQAERRIDIHCVTRWSKPGALFRGVPLVDLLDGARPRSEASFVSFVAYSARNHSTSLPLPEAISLGALLAIEADGRPLPPEHGGPVRIVVPGCYFYKSLKWLRRVELLSTDRLGYWEAEAGYHNRADPWREERYIAARLSRKEAAELIQARNFAGRDLLGIDAAGRDLAGLNAGGALLRNASFASCNLRGACFDGANLSNADLCRADLQGATFRGADVEGADFIAADLRGADFSAAASLLGAAFCRVSGGEFCDGAVIDESTRFDAAAIETLAPPQADYIRHARG